MWDTSFILIPGNFLKIVEKPGQSFKIIYRHLSQLFFLGEVKVSNRTLSNTGILGEEISLPVNFQSAINVTQTNNGDLVFMGSNNAFPSNVPSGFLLRTDCETSDFNNVITGRIYVDENFDCVYDSTEQLIPNYPIQLIHSTGLLSGNG